MYLKLDEQNGFHLRNTNVLMHKCLSFRAEYVSPQQKRSPQFVLSFSSLYFFLASCKPNYLQKAIRQTNHLSTLLRRLSERTKSTHQSISLFSTAYVCVRMFSCFVRVDQLQWSTIYLVHFSTQLQQHQPFNAYMKSSLLLLPAFGILLGKFSSPHITSRCSVHNKFDLWNNIG